MGDNVFRGLLVYGDSANPVPVTITAGETTGGDPDEYETVAAGQTDQVLGAGAGAVGDYFSHMVIVPAAADCGAVSIKDGAGGPAIVIFVGGGTVALPILAPLPVPIGLSSLNGGWRVTTGANVSVIVAGDFT